MGREEPFAAKKEETRAYYARNESNQNRFEDRSRYDTWRNNIRNDGFRRSGTNPQYFRTDSRRERWIRDDSRYGGRSRSRQPEVKRNSSRPDSRPRRDSRPGSKFRNRSKSMDRPKSELMKKIEVMEKDITAMKNSNKNVEEMVKKLTTSISTKFVEEEIFIDVKYVEKELENLMIVDSGAPVSLMSSAWLNNYLKEAKIDQSEVERSSSNRRFRLGKTPYVSTEKIKFPVVMKTNQDDFIKREVTANVIESNEVNLLCGKQTLKDWKTVLDFEIDQLTFKETGKEINLKKGSHMFVKLELVGKWQNEDAVW